MDYNHTADQEDLKARDEELYNIVIAACEVRDGLSFELNGEPYGKSETEKHLYTIMERLRNRLDAVLNPSEDAATFPDVTAMMESPEVKSWLA